ncbi:MAG: hypothetical protein H6673_00700 [Anaerolineales bacterium]|nr:hypothetical protein [Anaerolineales bacterium]
MVTIEADHIQLFMLIPVLINPDFYRMLDPDEPIDQQYIQRIVDGVQIASHPLPELNQPLFLTEDFKAVFRPTGLDLNHVNPQQSVQAIIPSMNIVVQLGWSFELMCNLGLLILELDMPLHTPMSQLNDLIDIAQHDMFEWDLNDGGWLLPHHSITQMLDVPPNEALSLARIVRAFEKLLEVKCIIKAQNPVVAFLLQMNIQGGDHFAQAADDFGEYLLTNRYQVLSRLLGYHANQQPFIGPNWRCAQNLDSGAWFEWLPPLHRDTPLGQHRFAAGATYTTSMHRRRAARRVFKICTMEYIAARLMAHHFASNGEARRLRYAIQSVCQDQQRNRAMYNDILVKLARLEARFILLNTNITNPDWVLDNPVGEGTHFIDMMRYIADAYGTERHIRALRQQLDLFNQMIDRCL